MPKTATAVPFQNACEVCTRRHSIAGQAHFECRARPPVQDVGLHARFPIVKADDYCHSDFELDGDAVAALNSANVEKMRLDGLVDVTRQSEAARVEAAAIPAAQPELALEPSPVTTPAPRARRARGSAITK